MDRKLKLQNIYEYSKLSLNERYIKDIISKIENNKIDENLLNILKDHGFNNNPEILKKELEAFIETNKQIIKNMKESKFLDSSDEKILKQLLKEIGSLEEQKAVNEISKNIIHENEYLSKTLTAINNAIEKAPINLFQKAKEKENLNNFIEMYKKEGELTPKILLEIENYLKQLENKGIIVEEKSQIEKINKILNVEKIKEKEYDKAFNIIKEFAENNNLTNSNLFKQLNSGLITIEEYLEKVYEENKNNNKILFDLKNTEENINKIFSKAEILKTSLKNILVDLSNNEEQFLEKVLKDYTEERIDEKQLNDKLLILAKGNNDTLEMLKKQLQITERSINNEELTNKQKIIQEKQIDILEELNNKLSSSNKNFNVIPNEGILAKIKKASNIQDATATLTEETLTKLFGKKGDELLNIITEKFFNKIGVNKWGKKLFGRLSGVFSSFGKNIVSKLGGSLIQKVGAISLPSIASAGSLVSGAGSMLSSAGSGALALASNPIGWAIAGATAIGAGAYGLYKLKYGKDKELIKELEKQGAVEYNFWGDSKIKDWGTILSLSPKQFDKIIHFNDWDKDTTKLLKKFKHVSNVDRQALSLLLKQGKAKIYKDTIFISNAGIDTLTKLNLSKKDYKDLLDSGILSNKSLKLLTKKSNFTKEIKKLEIENINEVKNTKSIKSLAKSAINNLSGIGIVTKLGQRIFGGDKYELVNRLEDEGIIKHYVIGNSEIIDWKAIEHLNPKQIKQLIDFNDWDEETEKRLKALYKKAKKSSVLNNVTNNVSYNEVKKVNEVIKQGIKDTATISALTGVHPKKVKEILNNGTNKITFNPNKIIEKTKNNEKSMPEENKAVIINNNTQVINASNNTDTIELIAKGF